MNDELNNGGEALDMRDTKTFVEALTRIPNVGTDADFQRINDEDYVAEFKEGALSLAYAAKRADMPLADFITHVSRLGIPVINQTAEEVQQDIDTLEQWLQDEQRD